MQILAKELIQVQIWYVLHISHVIPVVFDSILKADIWDYLYKVSHFLVIQTFAEKQLNYFGAMHTNSSFSACKLNLKQFLNPPPKILIKITNN